MRLLQTISLCSSAILLSLGEASGADHVDGFAGLPPGDKLEMRIISQGCFHFCCYDLAFKVGSNSTVVVDRPIEHQRLGELALSKNDIAGLDALLTFYRTNLATGCTTKDEIHISQIRDGRVVASEVFTDESCKVNRTKGVLSVLGLTRRLREQEAKK